MRLNTMKPGRGARQNPKRVGRGIGSGLGKTCGRGHKGQKARAGGYHKVGFEGGQMPLQRRLPKRGFNSLNAAATGEVRLGDLARVDGDVIDLAALKKAKLVGPHATRAKVFLSGSVAKALTLRGVAITAGARAAIVQAGGKVDD